MNDIGSDPKVQFFLKLSGPLLGIILIACSIFLVWMSMQKLFHPGHHALMDNARGGVVILACSVGVAVVGTRLLTGSRRRDGGILSPVVILCGGVLMAIAAPFAFFTSGNPHVAVAAGMIFSYVAVMGYRFWSQRRNSARNQKLDQ